MIGKRALYIILFSLFPLFSVGAKEAVNIFEYPRDMPSREIIAESGSKIKMKDFDGDFVLLVIWSRYCTPCIKELDNLNGFVEKTRGNGIRVVMLSPAEEWKNAAEQRAFLEKYQAPDLEFYMDKEGKMAEDLGVFSSPHTVLVNTKGQEIGRIRGSAEWDNDNVIEYIYKLKAKHG